MLGHHQEHHGGDHAVRRMVHVGHGKFAAVHPALQDAADQRVAGLDDLGLVIGGDVGEVVRLADDQLGDAGRTGGANALPPHVHGVAQHVGAAAVKGVELRVPFGEAAGDVLADDGLEEFFLALEIQEQRALGHARPRGNLFGSGGGKALFNEQVQRGVQQFAGPRLLATLALGRGVVRARADELGKGHAKLMTDWLVM